MGPTFQMPVSDDDPLRLEVAASKAFPDGSMTAAGLRREHRRGRLVIERVAGKDHTTLKAIREMREKCRNEARERVSGSNQQAERRRLPGSFETARSNDALVAVTMKLKELSRSICGFLGMSLKMFSRVYGHHHPDYQTEAVNALSRR